MSNKKGLIVAVALILIVAVGGFFGGSAYQKTQSASVQGNFNANSGLGAMGYGQNGNVQGQGMIPVTGKIASSDSESFTIKLDDGSSKIVLLNSKSSINKSSTVSGSDLKTGEQVMVIGTSNSDGSLTASSIQLGNLPDMPGLGGSPANGSNQNPAGNVSGTSNIGNSSSSSNNNAGSPGALAMPGAMGGPGGMGDPGAMGGPGAPPSN
jgi:hypothetical protein